MKVNCENCGMCCFSKIPESFYSEKIFMEREPGKSTYGEFRTNRVTLNKEEIKKFWEAGFGDALKILMIAGKEEITELLVTIRNFPKQIDRKWYLACPFLNPNTKRCRIHNTDLFPHECKFYPFNFIYIGDLPLCENNRIKEEFSEEQIKEIKESLIFNPSKVSLTFDISMENLQKILIEEFGGNNPYLLKNLLVGVFGEVNLKGEKKNFFKKINEKILKEFEFQRKNFDFNKREDYSNLLNSFITLLPFLVI